MTREEFLLGFEQAFNAGKQSEFPLTYCLEYLKKAFDSFGEIPAPALRWEGEVNMRAYIFGLRFVVDCIGTKCEWVASCYGDHAMKTERFDAEDKHLAIACCQDKWAEIWKKEMAAGNPIADPS